MVELLSPGLSAFYATALMIVIVVTQGRCSPTSAVRPTSAGHRGRACSTCATASRSAPAT